MLKIGLTGGIGSGKTTIAKALMQQHYPVYVADTAASEILCKDVALQQEMLAYFGPDIYFPDFTLNKKALADIIFNNGEALKKVNSLVHPRVLQDFDRWCKQQNNNFVFFESAILFEAGLHTHFDYIICVTADEATRLARVIQRDQTTAVKVRERMRNQTAGSEACKKSNFVIDTTDGESWKIQLKEIEKKLQELTNKLHINQK